MPSTIARFLRMYCFAILLLYSLSSNSDVNLVAVPGAIDPQIEPRAAAEDWIKNQPRLVRGGFPWEMRPHIYGFTEPPPVKQMYLSAEPEATTGLLLAWPSYIFNFDGALKIPEPLEIIRHSLGRVHISILTSASTRSRIENTLSAAGLDVAKIEFITFPREFPDNTYARTLDTIWIRDYGPVFVRNKNQKIPLSIVDMSYHPLQWNSRSRPSGRVRDDAVPTRLADHWGLQTYRPPLIAEGGNLQTDGNGTCFVTNRMATVNRNVFGDSVKWMEVLRDYYGCRRTVLLQGLSGELTGHVDMFMCAVSEKTIIVGDYKMSDDATNSEILNRNAKTLHVSGYTVIRIPMPQPYSISGSRIWATFTNALRVNSAMLVPVYRNPQFPPHLRQTIASEEAQALRGFRNALPGIDIIPIVADPLIPSGGSLHCIAMTYGKVRAVKNSKLLLE